MRRILRVLLIALALFVLVQVLRTAFASDATRIRWRIESMAEGFDDTRLAPCLQGIASDWRHAKPGIDRGRLADGLRALFFTEKDPETRGFPFRAQLVHDTLMVEVDPDQEGRAAVELELEFQFLEAGTWSPSWHVLLRGEMHEHDELGWQFQRSEHETLQSDGRLWR